MNSPSMTTVWLALHGAWVVSLLLRDGAGWRLLGTFVGFESMFVVETSGQTFSPMLVGLPLSAADAVVPLVLIVLGMLPLLLANAHTRAHGRIGCPATCQLRQRDTIAVSLMTLGMLLVSGSVILLILWHVIAAESLRLAREQ